MIVKFVNLPASIINLALECQESLSYDMQYQHVNRNQDVEVRGASIIISGERNALWGDSLAPLMEALRGFTPSEYHTSDARLAWYETFGQYCDHLPIDEAVELLPLWADGHSTPRAWQYEILQRAAAACRGLDDPMRYARAYAEGTLPGRAVRAAAYAFKLYQ